MNKAIGDNSDTFVLPLEALTPRQQHKGYMPTKAVYVFLANRSRAFLLSVFRFARDRAWHKGAYFWRQIKKETWRLLAGIPRFPLSEEE